MPTLPVELYVVRFSRTRVVLLDAQSVQIVEELEDRFGQQIEEILNKVKESLSTPADGAPKTNGVNINGQVVPQLATTQITIEEQEQQWDEDADAIYDEEYFDDTGTGAGVEGDLEMDED